MAQNGGPDPQPFQADSVSNRSRAPARFILHRSVPNQNCTGAGEPVRLLRAARYVIHGRYAWRRTKESNPAVRSTEPEHHHNACSPCVSIDSTTEFGVEPVTLGESNPAPLCSCTVQFWRRPEDLNPYARSGPRFSGPLQYHSARSAYEAQAFRPTLAGNPGLEPGTLQL